MDKKKYFLEIYMKAEKKYGKAEKRLAAEGWDAGWKVLISTIMSAQSRDETTIPIAEKLFRKYGSLRKLANANEKDVLKIFKSLNYNKTKAKNVVNASMYIVRNWKGKLPEDMAELVKLPGVGRKTANLVLWKAHGKHGITVDTHVHRISNVLGLVNTKSPDKTEQELMKIVPKRLWGKVNRIFVLWGKDVPGKDKERLLRKLS